MSLASYHGIFVWILKLFQLQNGVSTSYFSFIPSLKIFFSGLNMDKNHFSGLGYSAGEKRDKLFAVPHLLF